MRPRKVCTFPGCPILAIPGNHRCQRHYEPWAGAGRTEGRVPDGMKSRVLREEPGCRVCGAPTTDVDHIISWRQGGPTTRDNLQGLCRYHHNQKTGREAARGRRRRAEAE